MKLQIILIVVPLLLISGCGTINTVVREDSVTQRHLKELNSYCETVPRVYSGASYDFCTLYGPPVSDYGRSDSKLVVQYIADFVISGLVDTLLLPYTIYRQSKAGSINIK